MEDRISQVPGGLLDSSLDTSARMSLISSADGEAAVEGFSLKNVNLEIERGEKVMIFGNASSGKSSLLYSLCGEMFPMSSTTKIYKDGKIGLMSEKRFTKGGTIKDNICMNQPFDQEKMDLALVASQLNQDLDNMNNGLATVLADTSDSVSGGQKARICLARTFYQM
jgi:ABC-type bacteriocin/lantibiotic exporter with double-glycine peptidase domain